MTAYALVLFLHSWLRWLVLAAGLFAVVRALEGREGRGPSAAFVGLVDLQIVVGLLLYFVWSPVTPPHLHGVNVMKDPVLRFYAVEHLFAMIAAAVVLHVGSVRAKRKEGRARAKTAAVFGIIGLVLIVAGVPWPFCPYGRPMVRTSVTP